MCTDFAIQLERYILLDVFIVVEADEWFNVYIKQRNREQLSSFRFRLGYVVQQVPLGSRYNSVCQRAQKIADIVPRATDYSVSVVKQIIHSGVVRIMIVLNNSLDSRTAIACQCWTLTYRDGKCLDSNTGERNDDRNSVLHPEVL